MRSGGAQRASSPALRLASRTSKLVGSTAKMASLAESMERRYRSSESRSPCSVVRRAMRMASNARERSPSSPGARSGTAREKSQSGTPRAASVSTSSGLTSLPSTSRENRTAAAPRASPVSRRRSSSPWTEANASRSSWAMRTDQGTSRSCARAASQRVVSATTIPVVPAVGSADLGALPSSLCARGLARTGSSSPSRRAATAAEPKRGSSRNPASLDAPSGISPSSAPTGLPERSTMGWTRTAEGPGRQGRGCRETCGFASANARRSASCSSGRRAATRSASYGSGHRTEPLAPEREEAVEPLREGPRLFEALGGDARGGLVEGGERGVGVGELDGADEDEEEDRPLGTQAAEPARAHGRRGERTQSISVLASAITSTSLVISRSRGLQSTRRRRPAGSWMEKRPSSSTLVKNGFRSTSTHATISRCTLQRITCAPGTRKRNDRAPSPKVPRSNAGGEGEKTLWAVASWLMKSTVVPCSTGRTCGEKCRWSCFIVARACGGAVSSGRSSAYTTAGTASSPTIRPRASACARAAPVASSKATAVARVILERHEQGPDRFGAVRMGHLDDQVRGHGHVLLQRRPQRRDESTLGRALRGPTRLVATDDHQPGKGADARARQVRPR